MGAEPAHAGPNEAGPVQASRPAGHIGGGGFRVMPPLCAHIRVSQVGLRTGRPRPVLLCAAPLPCPVP
eukprot:5869465-Lingulodinium_polyedra.AAC.1